MSTPEEIQADIERQREQLAETVDQLTHKLDVKAQDQGQGRRAPGPCHDGRRQAPTRGPRRGRCGGLLVGLLDLVAAPLMFGRSQKVQEKAPAEKRVMEKTPTGRERSEEDVDREVDRPMPDPDDPRKPEAPTDLDKRSWFYVLRKTMHEFGDDQCTDLAAALTYYSVLAIFPAALALVSILGVVGQSQKAVDHGARHAQAAGLQRHARAPSSTHSNEIAASSSAGLALVIGRPGALWSASGYVGAFGRAMNRIYEIGEGRPFWKLRPMMLLLTLIAVVLAALVLLMLIVSGPVAESIGNVIGLGDTAVTVWQFAKWPVLLLVVVLIVALLYYATPNVKQPKFRGSRSAPSSRSSSGCWPRSASRSTWATSPATTRPMVRWPG